MKIIITLLMAMSLLLNSSCGNTADIRTDEHSGSGTENITTKETTVTRESESTTADAETAATTPETAKPVDEYDDNELQNIIDRSLDTLTDNTTGLFTTDELIAAHPEAFEAIVSLGKKALPYLEKYTNTDREMTSGEANRCVIARTAAYAIDPSLYDLVYESPDGKAKLKFTVRTLNGRNWLHPEDGMTYDLSLIIPGSDGPIVLSDKCYTKAEVSWSDDGNYAMLCCQQESGRFPAVGLLVDIAGGGLIELPSLEVYNRLIKEEPDSAPFAAFSAAKCEWASEREIKVSFLLSVGASFYPREISGHYIWNMDKRAMTDCVFDPGEIWQSDTSLTDEEIFEIVDKNLDVIVNGGNILSEDDLLSAYPDEVAEIVSFGKNALGVLERIIELDHAYYENTMASIPKGLVAKIIAYIIDPSLYDLSFEAPDGLIRLRFGVETFTCIVYHGDMTTAYSQIDIISRGDNSVISAFDTDRSYGSYTDINVNWSEDSAYAAVSFSNEVFYRFTDIIDTREPEVIALPSIQDSILPATGVEVPYDGVPDDVSYSVDEWLQDSNVRIKYYIRYSDIVPFIREGKYLFDIKTRTFSDEL